MSSGTTRTPTTQRGLSPGQVQLGEAVAGIVPPPGPLEVVRCLDDRRHVAMVRGAPSEPPLGILKVFPGEDATSVLREIALATLLPEMVVGHIWPAWVGRVRLASGDSVAGLLYAVPQVVGVDLGIETAKAALHPLNPRTAPILGMALGLAGMHLLGIAHRDIKPANVLVTAGTSAMWIDLGSAGAIHRSRAVQLCASLLLGETDTTPGYRAPEERGGLPADLARVDVYKLGLVGAQLLTGDPDPDEAVERLSVRSVPVLGGPSDFATVRALVQRALEPDPSARPADARALVTSARESWVDTQTLSRLDVAHGVWLLPWLRRHAAELLPVVAYLGETAAESDLVILREETQGSLLARIQCAGWTSRYAVLAAALAAGDRGERATTAGGVCRASADRWGALADEADELRPLAEHFTTLAAWLERGLAEERSAWELAAGAAMHACMELGDPRNDARVARLLEAGVPEERMRYWIWSWAKLQDLHDHLKTRAELGSRRVDHLAPPIELFLADVGWLEIFASEPRLLSALEERTPWEGIRRYGEELFRLTEGRAGYAPASDDRVMLVVLELGAARDAPLVAALRPLASLIPDAFERWRAGGPVEDLVAEWKLARGWTEAAVKRWREDAAWVRERYAHVS